LDRTLPTASIATILVERALWQPLTAEVLTLRHCLLSGRQTHDTLLNRAFDTTLHVARKLALATRSITEVRSLSAARIGAAISSGTLPVSTSTELVDAALHLVLLDAEVASFESTAALQVAVTPRSGTAAHLAIGFDSRARVDVIPVPNCSVGFQLTPSAALAVTA
jgi:hypothetical protein